jgi:hypothetical protein
MQRPYGVPTYVVAAGLMWVGGFVDAIGFLTLRRVYLGNMSGDTVRVGLALAARDWPELFIRASPILSFGAGLLAGALVQDIARRRGIRRLLALALSVEASCLAAIWIIPAGEMGTRVFFGAAAMGIQNTSLRNSGVLSLYTTHVTGLLTELTEQLSALLAGFIGVDHIRGGVRGGGGAAGAAGTIPAGGDPAAASWLTLLFALWTAGVVVASITLSWGRVALALPLGLVLVAAAVDVAHPLAGRA